MLARCTTYVLDGITAHPVTVECDIRPGLPAFTLLGLPDVAARDLRETVRAAIQNSGHTFPQRRVTLNIAPGWLRRGAPSLPLAVAVSVLAAAGEIPADQAASVAVFGGLTLGGEITPLAGTLAAAAEHRSSGCTGPLLYGGPPLPADLTPVSSAPVAHLTQLPTGPSAADPEPAAPVRAGWRADYADVRGHDAAIFALTVAAAGGHHVLLRGAEGSGATMLARRLVTILPELTLDEQREVATIRDAAGLGQERDRPFRAPHPTTSAAGLAGGGSPMRPGEATLAHRGVLLLSPLDEFPRSTLEALRAPLDDQTIAIVRGDRAYRFPSSFQLVATASPCPCGHGATGPCVCDTETLARHRRRLCTPLLDRFAIVIDLPFGRDLQGAAPGPSSPELADRVSAARERRSLRDASAAPAGEPSADAITRSLLSVLSDVSQAAIEQVYTSGSLSPRGRLQLLQVAQTVADLAGEASITPEAVTTALALRGHHAAPPLALAC